MMEICAEGSDRLTDSTQSLDRFGVLLNEQWKVKRSLTNKITNKEIDEIYDAGINAGALGGKLLGAGGGGFFTFYCENNHSQLSQAMTQEGLRELRYDFDFTGSRVQADLSN